MSDFSAPQVTRRIVRHLAMIWQRLLEILSDNNQGWLVIVVCLTSVAMSVRMASAAGWIHSLPMVSEPMDGSVALVNSSNHFWRSTLNAGLMSVVLAGASALTLVGMLEKWRRAMLVGLFLLMLAWYPISVQATYQLGLAISGMYLAIAIGSSAAFYKAFGVVQQHQHQAAEVDEAVKLIGALYEEWEQAHAASH